MTGLYKQEAGRAGDGAGVTQVAPAMRTPESLAGMASGIGNAAFGAMIAPGPTIARFHQNPREHRHGRPVRRNRPQRPEGVTAPGRSRITPGDWEALAERVQAPTTEALSHVPNQLPPAVARSMLGTFRSAREATTQLLEKTKRERPDWIGEFLATHAGRALDNAIEELQRPDANAGIVHERGQMATIHLRTAGGLLNQSSSSDAARAEGEGEQSRPSEAH